MLRGNASRVGKVYKGQDNWWFNIPIQWNLDTTVTLRTVLPGCCTLGDLLMQWCCNVLRPFGTFPADLYRPAVWFIQVTVNSGSNVMQTDVSITYYRTVLQFICLTFSCPCCTLFCRQCLKPLTRSSWTAWMVRIGVLTWRSHKKSAIHCIYNSYVAYS